MIKIPLLISTSIQIVEGKAHTPVLSLNQDTFENSIIDDFGSNFAYFCHLSENYDELKRINHKLLTYLKGTYLFISTSAHAAPYLCMGFSNNWLRLNYHPNEFDLKSNEQLVKKIQNEFTTKYSLLSSKYLTFHKQYYQSTFRHLFLQAYCTQFVYDIVQFIATETFVDEKQKTRDLEVRKIKEIQDKINSELYKTPPTIKEMAAMVGMSISKFKILFNETFGESPHQYVLERKLLLAKELLRTGNYSISQVSYKVGFNHPSGFTRLFKNKFNQPPSSMIEKYEE